VSEVWVALAGGVGAGARFVLDGLLTERSRRNLPTATLIINVLGSFLLGMVTGWAAAHDGAPMVRAVAGVGFLGGFTTLSTASVELVRLVRAERPLAATGLAVAMIAVSIAVAALGLILGQLVA
jgi:fluoride exporter